MDQLQTLLIEQFYLKFFHKRTLPAPYSVLREPSQSLLGLWARFRSSCDTDHSGRDLFLQLACDFSETVRALASHSQLWIQVSESNDDRSVGPLVSDNSLRLCNEFQKRLLFYTKTIEIILDAVSRCVLASP